MAILMNKKYLGNIEEMNFLDAVDPQNYVPPPIHLLVLIPKVTARAFRKILKLNDIISIILYACMKRHPSACSFSLTILSTYIEAKSHEHMGRWWPFVNQEDQFL